MLTDRPSLVSSLPTYQYVLWSSLTHVAEDREASSSLVRASGNGGSAAKDL